MRRLFVDCGSWRPTQVDWCTAMACIQNEERERISKFVFQKDAKMSLVGRLLLRAVVVKSECVENKDVLFSRSPKGKPILLCPQQSSVNVNISHHGHCAVVAMERGREVGADVMQVTKPRGQSTDDFFHTMRRQFTEGEWSHILAPPTNQQRLKMFYRFWCLKESLIKAEGSGLSYGLQRLEYTPHPIWPPPSGSCCTGSIVMIDGVVASDWTFEESFINDDHCVSVAVRQCCRHGDSNEAPPTFSEVKTTPTGHILHLENSDYIINVLSKLSNFTT